MYYTNSCSSQDDGLWNRKNSHEMFYKEFANIIERADSKNNTVTKVISRKFSEIKIAVLQEITKYNPSTSKEGIVSFPACKQHFNRKRLMLL